MLDVKHRIEQLNLSVAECNLLALLIYNPVKIATLQQLARNIKAAARNLAHPPSDGAAPFAKSLTLPLPSLPSAVAAFARAA